MVDPYFAFKGINSKDLGLIITELPPDNTIDNEGEFINIPARDGYLYIDSGRKAPISKTIQCVYPNAANVDGFGSVTHWLSGRGELILSREPHIFYEAQIESVREYKGHQRNVFFNITFKCQPLKYYIAGKSITTIITTPSTISNYGKSSKPIITIYGNGLISLSINDQLIQATIDEYLTIDSYLLECYKDNEIKTFIGPFIDFKEGINNISYTGNISKIEVIPRWHK